MNTKDKHIISLAMDIIEWHKKRVSNCNLVIDNEDADISLRLGEGRPDYVIDADSEKARWIRVGMSLALEQFQPCPVTLNTSDVNGDEEDCDDE